MLKVLGRTGSINVRKVLWVCLELGLPYEVVPWGTPELPLASAAFRALNPNAMVPVLLDGPLVLWESNAICRYLAGAYGGTKLLPTPPGDRAKVEQWMDWQATEMNNAWRYAYMGLVRKSALHADTAAIDASLAAWNRHMGMLAEQLARTDAFVAGPDFTLADVVLGLTLNRWRMTPMAPGVRADLPALDAWEQRLRTHAGYLEHGCNGMP